MLLDQAPSLERSPPAVFWIVVFLTSFAAMFYLGLSPELIDEWYLVLVGFNVVMSLVALYFLVLNMRRLKQNTDQDVIGSKFTWSLVKIIPVLVLLPVLSFYFFSFESIRDNLNTAEVQFDKFNITVAGEVDELYKNTSDIVIKYYLDRTYNIAKLINYFDAPRSSKMKMQRVLEQLAMDNWACELKLYDSQMILMASTASEKTCLEEGYTASTDDFTLISHYSGDTSITSLSQRMTRFRDAAKDAKLEVGTSIIQTRFMIDFSSTVLLAVLSALLVVLKMIDQFIRPMRNP
jgi:hypothetical protein